MISRRMKDLNSYAAVVKRLGPDAEDYEIETLGRALYRRYIVDECIVTGATELTSQAHYQFSKDYPIHTRTRVEQDVLTSLLIQINKRQNIPNILRSLVDQGLMKPNIVGEGRMAAVAMDSHIELQADKRNRALFKVYGKISALSWYVSWHKYVEYGTSLSMGYVPRIMDFRFHSQMSFPKMMLRLMEDHIATPMLTKIGALAFAGLFDTDVRYDYFDACGDELDALIPCFFDKIGRHKQILPMIASSKSPYLVFQSIATAFGVRAIVALSLQPFVNAFQRIQTEAERPLEDDEVSNRDRIIIAEIAFIAKLIWSQRLIRLRQELRRLDEEFERVSKDIQAVCQMGAKYITALATARTELYTMLARLATIFYHLSERERTGKYSFSSFRERLEKDFQYRCVSSGAVKVAVADYGLSKTKNIADHQECGEFLQSLVNQMEGNKHEYFFKCGKLSLGDDLRDVTGGIGRSDTDMSNMTEGVQALFELDEERWAVEDGKRSEEEHYERCE